MTNTPTPDFDVVSALLADAAALVQATLAEVNESLETDNYIGETVIRTAVQAVQAAVDELLLTVDATDFIKAPESTAADDLAIETARNLNGIAVITAKDRG